MFVSSCLDNVCKMESCQHNVRTAVRSRKGCYEHASAGDGPVKLLFTLTHTYQVSGFMQLADGIVDVASARCWLLLTSAMITYRKIVWRLIFPYFRKITLN